MNVRNAFRLVELSLPRALPPITLGAYARTFVHEVNYEKKYLILSEEGGGLHLYNLSPPKVWAILRTLLETDDPRGWVRLPEYFRSQFSTKDASGNRVKDDLWRLSLHIHSAQNGEYYLSPLTRTPQKWDR